MSIDPSLTAYIKLSTVANATCESGCTCVLEIVLLGRHRLLQFCTSAALSLTFRKALYLLLTRWCLQLLLPPQALHKTLTR